MARISWADKENDLIVADYFAMLREELNGHPCSKAEHRRVLQPLLDGRSAGATEYKHQNISAILKTLGEEWNEGYKPAFNFQSSLVDAVVRWPVLVHAITCQALSGFRACRRSSAPGWPTSCIIQCSRTERIGADVAYRAQI